MAFLLSMLPALGSGLISALKGGASSLMKGEGIGSAIGKGLSEGLKSATGVDLGGLVEGAKNLLSPGPQSQIAKGELLKRGLRGIQGGLQGLGLPRDLRKKFGDTLRRNILPLKGYKPPAFMLRNFVSRPYHDRIQDMIDEDEMEEPVNFIDRTQDFDEQQEME